jgi:hypothetical protein
MHNSKYLRTRSVLPSHLRGTTIIMTSVRFSITTSVTKIVRGPTQAHRRRKETMNEFLKFVLCCIITFSSSTTAQLTLKKKGGTRKEGKKPFFILSHSLHIQSSSNKLTELFLLSFYHGFLHSVRRPVGGTNPPAASECTSCRRLCGCCWCSRPLCFERPSPGERCQH